MRYTEIINETSSAGGSCAGGVATAVSGLGAGDPKASIYYSAKNKDKKKKESLLIRRVLKSEKNAK